MGSTTSGSAFAAANAAMTQGVDGASTVHVLLADCLGLLGAGSAGVMVSMNGRGLELLAATSHQARELELYQLQSERGPCVETVETGVSVHGSADTDLDARWPGFGRAMAAAGLQTVYSTPMRWHDHVLGGLNLFWADPRTLSREEQGLAQAFADISTLALMQPPVGDEPVAIEHMLRTALEGRVVIERAKGILAHTEHLEMDDAFARLVQLSQQTGQPLARVAQDLLDDVVRR